MKDDVLPRRRKRRERPTEDRGARYRQLRNPFPTMDAVSADEARAIHEAALDVLERLGVRVLLPEARALLHGGGAIVGGDHVLIGREMVEAALAAAPRSFVLRGARPERDVRAELGTMSFQPGAGAPHATDRVRGRRPGTLSDLRDLVRLTQAFDVLHMAVPSVEPQDVAPPVRHYAQTDLFLSASDKLPFVYARGSPQVEDAFEMIRLARGLDADAFAAEAWCYTIINTNSPRTLDVPMAQGLIDFARAGQASVITPFTLMGAMAPITVAGAITLSHAEALAALTVAQLAKPGAPVLYGTFTSNVDMGSGAPVFGTPEHFKASLLAGQMARLIGLPWRSATGSAANLSDVQAAQETQAGLWGCLMAGATMTVHAAGWQEGGLTVGYEKLVQDVDLLETVAEMCRPVEASADAIGLEAIEEVAPQGHFFATQQTMARYATEFWRPRTYGYDNVGLWEERGGPTSTERATAVWQGILSAPEAEVLDGDRAEAMRAFARAREAEGGAPPVS